MDVDSCIQTYTTAFDRVFGSNPTLKRPSRVTKYKAKYESAELERTLRETLLRAAGRSSRREAQSMRGRDQPLMRDGNGLDVRCKV